MMKIPLREGIEMARLYDDPGRALRYAKTIASDMVEYNKDALLKALKEDNVWEALEEQIRIGREEFNARVTPEIAQSNIYERALVEVLLYRMKDRLRSPIWDAE